MFAFGEMTECVYQIKYWSESKITLEYFEKSHDCMGKFSLKFKLSFRSNNNQLSPFRKRGDNGVSRQVIHRAGEFTVVILLAAYGLYKDCIEEITSGLKPYDLMRKKCQESRPLRPIQLFLL